MQPQLYLVTLNSKRKLKQLLLTFSQVPAQAAAGNKQLLGSSPGWQWPDVGSTDSAQSLVPERTPPFHK